MRYKIKNITSGSSCKEKMRRTVIDMAMRADYGQVLKLYCVACHVMREGKK